MSEQLTLNEGTILIKDLSFEVLGRPNTSNDPDYFKKINENNVIKMDKLAIFIASQRLINKKHCESMANEFDLYKVDPVLTVKYNNKLYVYDGQHRAVVCCYMGLNYIPYVMMADYSNLSEDKFKEELKKRFTNSNTSIKKDVSKCQQHLFKNSNSDIELTFNEIDITMDEKKWINNKNNISLKNYKDEHFKTFYITNMKVIEAIKNIATDGDDIGGKNIIKHTFDIYSKVFFSEYGGISKYENNKINSDNFLLILEVIKKYVTIEDRANTKDGWEKYKNLIINELRKKFKELKITTNHKSAEDIKKIEGEGKVKHNSLDTVFKNIFSNTKGNYDKILQDLDIFYKKYDKIRPVKYSYKKAGVNTLIFLLKDIEGIKITNIKG